MSHCSTSFYYTLQSNDFPHRVFFLFIDYFYVKKKYPGGHITLYYGSQTGTAETFAKDIEREGEENGFKMEVIDLEDIEDDILASVLKEQKKDDRGKNRAIFVMATYGEGEPTDNAVSFMRFLKNGSTEDEMDDGEEKKGDDFLNQNTSLFLNLEYAVFGLGNRQYEHFNSTGKQVDSFLERGGALRRSTRWDCMVVNLCGILFLSPQGYFCLLEAWGGFCGDFVIFDGLGSRFF